MKDKRKVLFIGRFPPPMHGASKMNELYYNSKIIREKFHVRKIKINYSETLDELGRFNIKKFFGVFIVFFQVLKNLISFRPNVVDFEIAPHGVAFYRDSIYALLFKLFGKKVIYHLHSKEVTNNFYTRFIYNNSKVVILSEGLLSSIKGVVNRKNQVIINNGLKDTISDKQFEAILKERKKEKVPQILFLSNLIISKGSIDTLKICKELKEKKKEFRCSFVGSWPDEATKKAWNQKLHDYKLEDYCKYLGPKYGKEKNKILAKTKIMILPTQYKTECYPLVILEAFMFGIPVLSYDNGAIKEIIIKNEFGKVVKKGEWKKLAKHLNQNIDKKTNAQKIRNHFKEKHLVVYSEKKLLDLLKKSV
ncbi:glycosyltransferase family 4 protein [Candidatus Pacearchaeota archaeon]|nr:glycosyltransferase family 4 protein [Candidatus Pacearchaeota archaeon]